MRLVFDTNVLVSGLRSRRGASNRLLIEVVRGQAVWLCSVPLFLEYEAVLTRPEFLLATGYREADVRRFLDDASIAVEPVELTYLWRPILRDPNDEMVLESAVNGQADTLVTHNRRDFEPAIGRFSFDVDTPKSVLERLD